MYIEYLRYAIILLIMIIIDQLRIDHRIHFFRKQRAKKIKKTTLLKYSIVNRQYSFLNGR